MPERMQDDDELDVNDEILQHFYEEYVAPRLRRSRALTSLADIEAATADLTDALRAIRFLQDTIDDSPFLSREAVEWLKRKGLPGTRLNADLLRETGFAELLDDHFQDIINRITVRKLPHQDVELMRRSGSAHPDAELELLLNRLRDHGSELIDDFIDEKLDRAARVIESQSEPPDAPAGKSRWLKGVGKIFQGRLLSLSNLSLGAAAILWWPAVSAAAASNPIGAGAGAGAVVGSIAMGVGAVLEGADEIR